jgi:acyl-CoA reductase-like NAD-dependent aldehyde dehydrogenase
MTIARDLLIGGKAVPAAAGRQTEDRSPYTGDVYATIAAAGPQDVVVAVDAAQAAFPAWAATPPSTRRFIAFCLLNGDQPPIKPIH